MPGRTRGHAGLFARKTVRSWLGGSEQALSHRLAERIDEEPHCMRVNGDVR